MKKFVKNVLAIALAVAAICAPALGAIATASGNTTASSNTVPAAPVYKEEVVEAVTVVEVEERVVAEESYVVNVVSEDKYMVVPEVASAIPTGTYNFSNFVTTKGFVTGLDKVIKADTASNQVAIYSAKPFPFSNAVIKAINDGKKDVEYFFTYKGHTYSITIPANADASKLFGNNRFAGPLYIGQQLGTTKLVK